MPVKVLVKPSKTYVVTVRVRRPAWQRYLI